MSITGTNSVNQGSGSNGLINNFGNGIVGATGATGSN
jgi:hypothetical protein